MRNSSLIGARAAFEGFDREAGERKFMKRLKKAALIAVTTSALVLAKAMPAEASLPPALSGVATQIYNADFAAAGASINSYISSKPKDPSGYLLRGMLSEWDQIINNKRKALNPKILADYQKANDLALTAYEADPENVEKMVLLGNTYMYVAKKLVDNGSKMSGGFALKKAKNLMLQAIAKDPENEDAYMALGVFNYFSANVPSGFKFLAGVLGFNGDEAKGLDYLKRAAEQPNLTQGDAGFLLVYVYYDKEKDYAAAERYNDIMKARYPDNPTFQYHTGELVFRQKKYQASRDEFAKFWTFCDGKPKGFCNDKYLFLSHYFMTWGYAQEKNYAAMKSHLELAIKLNDGQYEDRNVDLDLWAGVLAARDGDKAKAMESFKKVQANKTKNQRAWAQAQKEMTALGK